jgi:glycosyltransferase involved in cell wall biosynthesis
VSRPRDSDLEGRLLVPTPPAGLEALGEAPPFSIVIPTYQSADTVGASVRSALDQTHRAQEVIVVDDGSTDDVEGALQPFRDRIELVTKENGGGASALNAGARAASGEFLAILDADDTYHPRRLEAMARLAAARPDLDLVTTDARFVVEGRGVGSLAADTPFATRGQRTAIFESCFVGGWPAVRIERLREVGWFDETLRTGYDWDCWMRVLLSGGGAGLVNEALYDYHLHAGSLTGSRVSTLWDRVTLLEKAAGHPGLRREERPDLARAIRRHRSRAIIAEAHEMAGRPGSRTRFLRLAFSRGAAIGARLAALLAATFPALARRMVPEDRPAEERLAAR